MGNETTVTMNIERYAVLKRERSPDHSNAKHRTLSDKSSEFQFYAKESQTYRTKAKRLRKKVKDIMYANSCGPCHICADSKILIRVCGNEDADCVSCKECYIANIEAQKVSFLLSQSSIAPFSCMFCKSMLRGDALSSDEIENVFNSDEFRNKVIAQKHKNDQDEDNAVQEIQE
jgi:hypothetical protein